MSFASKIRVVPFAQPDCHVILTETVCSVVFFQGGVRSHDHTASITADKPPQDMFEIELEHLADGILIDALQRRPFVRRGPILTGDREVIGYEPRDPPLTPEARVEAALRSGDPEQLKEAIRAAGVTFIESKPALPALPAPDTKARGKVTIARLLKVDDSSIVAHVGYDAVTCTLEVGIKQASKAPTAKKKKGARRRPLKKAPIKPLPVLRYRYKDVPKEVFVGLATSLSAGTYFNEMVKPHYIGRRVP